MSGAEKPEPLVRPDVDLRGFPFTPIFRARLFGSSFHARASDAEWRAGVTLWLKSWDQAPAGSLPDDDIDLCRLAELGRDMKTWRKLKAMALHGWTKCADGRLYHAVVAEGVNDAWNSKIEQRQKTLKARIEKARKVLAQTTDPDERARIEAQIQELSQSLSQGLSQTPKTSVTDATSPPVTESVTASNREGTDTEREQNRQGYNKEAKAPPTTPAPAEPSPAVAVIRLLDEAIARHFGAEQARPWPASTDGVTAQRFLDAGANLFQLAALFDTTCQRMAAQGKPKPKSLAMFEADVGELVRNAGKPLNGHNGHANGGAQAEPRDPISDDRLRWLSRGRGWIDRKFWLSMWGDPPDHPRTDMPAAIRAELGIAISPQIGGNLG